MLRRGDCCTAADFNARTASREGIPQPLALHEPSSKQRCVDPDRLERRLGGACQAAPGVGADHEALV
jgi:hypothetical protein